MFISKSPARTSRRSMILGSTPNGELILTVMGGMAEFELGMMRTKSLFSYS